MVLTRKKITVRRKGKTFQRSVMVKSEGLSAGQVARKHGAALFGAGLVSGAYGAGIGGAAMAGTWPRRPSKARLIGSVLFGAFANRVAHNTMKRSSQGQKVMRTIYAASPWGKATAKAINVAGNLVGAVGAAGAIHHHNKKTTEKFYRDMEDVARRWREVRGY
jgi:hypothetical protein